MASGDVNSHTSLDIYINNLKSSISLWEDMTLKSQKLNSNLKITAQSINSVIESLSSVCKITENAHYSGLDNTENLLTDLSIREKYISEKIQLLNNAVQNNLVTNLSSHIENWKKTITSIKKERDVDYRKAKIDFKKAIMELSKLENKMSKRSNNKNSLSDTITLQIDYANQNLQNKKRFIEELERCSLKKAVCEERNRFRQFLECLRPILDAQLSMKADLDELQQTYDKLYSSNADDLSTLPDDIESYVRQYQVLDNSRVNSLSSLYSRVNSQLSLSNSYCSTMESSTYLQMFNSTMNSAQLESPGNPDTSTSTIQDFNANLPSPPPPLQQSITENELSDNEPSSGDDPTNKKSTFHSTEDPLYPNQAIPQPRYSNLRELKQIAERKYGTYAIRNRADQAPRDINLSKRSSLIVESDIKRIHKYTGCLSYDQAQDSDAYTAVYGTSPIFADVVSGTSTFKRRKPSLAIAMETPTILDQYMFQKPERPIENIRNQRSLSEDRINCDINHVCNSVERTFLGPRPMPPRNSRVNSCCSTMYINDMVRFPNSKMNNTLFNASNNQYPQQLSDGMMVSKHPSITGNDAEFKNQLLKVIQGSRPSYKSVSPISSQMF